MTKTKRHYYVGVNNYGIDYTYDSDGWYVLRFDSYQERQAWLDEYQYDERGNLTSEKITRKIAEQIAGRDMVVRFQGDGYVVMESGANW